MRPTGLKIGQLLTILLLFTIPLGSAFGAQEASGEFPPRQVTFGFPHLEWQIPNPTFDGNPFDLIARVTFVHESGAEHRTEMFYAGNEVWAFRFTGTELGKWSFETESADADLDGLTGRVTVVENPDSEARGFLVAEDGKLVVPAGSRGQDLEGVLYNVYLPSGGIDLAGFPSDEESYLARMDEMLDEAEANGFPAVFLTVYNSWFSFGSQSYDEHESEDPDLQTFALLDAFIMRAHRRGMYIHLWSWGDQQRRWTPVGVGGINGGPDRRLQRYIAARLGPLPGWTMSYGFDLEEWVTPREVEAWGEYLGAHLGWPHPLMAREHGEHQGYTFQLEQGLDIYATDDRPFDDPGTSFYELARARLEERGKPVLFERRFLHTRDGVWTMEATRRALWQFTMAGGAGAIWGVIEWEDGPPYPQPGQLRTHARFWRDRFLPSLLPVDGADGVLAMATPQHDRLVFYAEEVEELRLDLQAAGRSLRAVAVDTAAKEYQEISLGELPAGDVVWEAPYRSDWALAVGFDEEQAAAVE